MLVVLQDAEETLLALGGEFLEDFLREPPVVATLPEKHGKKVPVDHRSSRLLGSNVSRGNSGGLGLSLGFGRDPLEPLEVLADNPHVPFLEVFVHPAEAPAEAPEREVRQLEGYEQGEGDEQDYDRDRMNRHLILPCDLHSVRPGFLRVRGVLLRSCLRPGRYEVRGVRDADPADPAQPEHLDGVFVELEYCVLRVQAEFVLHIRVLAGVAYIVGEVEFCLPHTIW